MSEEPAATYLGTWEIGHPPGSYSIVKYRIRKQWALVCNDRSIRIVAYFRTRQDAENLARAFGWEGQ